MINKWLIFIITLFVSLSSTQAKDLVEVKPQQVAPHTYFVKGYAQIGGSANQNFISNSGFVVTPKGVVVIDALGTPVLAQKLINQIKKITNQKVVAVIITHYHADHVYGLEVFKKEGATIYAQELGKDYLQSDNARLRLESSRVDFFPWINASTQLISADVWIKDEFQFNVGGVDFFLKKVGPAHTSEDLVIYVPSEKVLFVGDLVFRGRVPYVGNADSKGWLASLEKISDLPAKVILPGHGDFSANPKNDIQFTKSYLNYLRSSMGEAARNLDSFDDVYKNTDWSKYEKMPLFRHANRMNAYNIYLSIQGE